MALPGEPRRITVAQAHALLAASRAVIADVRDEKLYDNAHIAGAVSLSPLLLRKTFGQVPAAVRPPVGGTLILYCA